MGAREAAGEERVAAPAKSRSDEECEFGGQKEGFKTKKNGEMRNKKKQSVRS